MTSAALHGRRALVTGASRGLGAAIARGLSAAGADVVGLARTIDAMDETARAVRAHGRDFFAVSADVADRSSLTAALSRLAGERIDILVNNAGLIERGPAETHGAEQWDRVLEADLSAQFFLAQALGVGMLQRGAGKVIFIASMQSHLGGPNIVGYAAAKAGLVGVVRTLACEWAGRGVNVNAIAPGYFETEMTAIRHRDPTARARVESRIPAGRWGRPDDIAGAAVFLASAASDYVHGAVIPVDGGYSAL